MRLSRRTLAVALVLAGCHRSEAIPAAPDDVDPSWSLRPAVVDLSRSSVQALAAPMSARAGVPFVLTVNSYGSSTCTRLGSDRLEIAGLVADVTVQNWEAPEGSTCTRDIHFIAHEVPIRFTQAGNATIRVHARDPQGKAFTSELVVRVDP